MSTEIEIVPFVNTKGMYSQTEGSTPINTLNTEGTLIGNGIGSLSVPANTFKVGDMFRIKMNGRCTNGNNSVLNFKIKGDGGTPFLDSSFTMSQTTDKIWSLDFDFVIKQIGSAGTASIQTSGMFNYIKNASTSHEGFMFDENQSTSFDTTILNTLNITAKWTTINGSASIHSHTFNLLKIY